MPTEGLRSFSITEKSIIRSADSVEIVIHELVIAINKSTSKIKTSLNFTTRFECENKNAFLDIKFTNLNYKFDSTDNHKHLLLYIEIISIHEEVKNAVKKYCIEK